MPTTQSDCWQTEILRVDACVKLESCRPRTGMLNELSLNGQGPCILSLCSTSAWNSSIRMSHPWWGARAIEKKLQPQVLPQSLGKYPLEGVQCGSGQINCSAFMHLCFPKGCRALWTGSLLAWKTIPFSRKKATLRGNEMYCINLPGNNKPKPRKKKITQHHNEVNANCSVAWMKWQIFFVMAKSWWQYLVYLNSSSTEILWRIWGRGELWWQDTSDHQCPQGNHGNIILPQHGLGGSIWFPFVCTP